MTGCVSVCSDTSSAVSAVKKMHVSMLYGHGLLPSMNNNALVNYLLFASPSEDVLCNCDLNFHDDSRKWKDLSLIYKESKMYKMSNYPRIDLNMAMFLV